MLASAPAAQRAPALTIKTAHAATAARVAAYFDVEQDLPTLKRGQNWSFELGDTRTLQVKVEEGMIGNLQVLLRPKKLNQIYPDAWASIGTHARETFASVMQDAGLEPPAASPIFDAWARIPEQVEQVRVRADGDLGHPLENLNVQIWVRAAPKTWLKSFIAAAKPLGLPTILRVATDSAMTMRVGIDLSDARDVLRPVTRLIASRVAASAEQAARSAQVYLDNFDGSMTAAWNPRTGSMVFVAGVRESATTNKLYNHPSFTNWLESTQTTPSGFDVKFTPNAIEHRGSRIWKSVARPSAEVANRLPDRFLQSEIVSYGGLAGDYVIGATGVEESFVKGIVDRAVGHQFKRTVMPRLTFLNAHVRLADFLEASGREMSNRLPNTIGCGLGTSGDLLFLRVKLQ